MIFFFKRFFLIFCMALSLSFMAKAADPIILDEAKGDINMRRENIDIFEDPGGQLSFEQIRKQLFHISGRNYSYTRDSGTVYWVRFAIIGHENRNCPWVLELFDTKIDKIEMYSPLSDSTWTCSVSGADYSFDKREYSHINFVFNLNTNYTGERFFYVKIKSEHPTRLRWKIRTTNYFSYYAVNEYYILGLYYGILLIMGVYNLMLFFSFREKVYLIYVVFTAVGFVSSLVEDGLGFSYYWPKYPGLDDQLVFYLRCLFLLSFVWYSVTFLKLKETNHGKKWILLIRSVSILYGVCFIYGLLTGDYYYQSVLFGIVCIILYIAGIYVWIKSYVPARYYVIGLTILLPCLLIILLKDNHVNFSAIRNPLTEKIIAYALKIGIIAEVIILSLALTDRIRFLRIEKEKSDKQMITQLMEDEKALELKVAERTEIIQKQKEELVEQNKKYHSLYKEITDNIQTAKFIQNSILPKLNLSKEFIPDMFVFFRPKDIVSGDFYWSAYKNEKIYLAAIDCTGHGVAGGFMSMIAYTLLNRIIYEINDPTPDQILIELHRRLSKELNRTSDSKSQEGMDVALITLHIKNRTLEFSGAQSPLYYVRQNEMQIIKGDKYSIGSRLIKDNFTFALHKLNIEQNDIFYIFSDGIAGQLGGPDGISKLMYPRLREHLLQHQHEAADDQLFALVQFFDQWKDRKPQTDDVLLIGFRL